MIIFWTLTTIALALGVFSLLGDGRRNRLVAQRLRQPPLTETPPASIIVPIKGYDEGLAENLASLANQDYPDYELIVVARTIQDVPDGVLPPIARLILAADGNPDTGEKVNNLLVAVGRVAHETEILAFADSDGRCTSGWLTSLVQGLNEDRAGASTGYRWHIPEPPDFWSLVRSVWNGVVAGELGQSARFAWGGAMAIRRDLFYTARVPEFWHGAVSDDYTLTAAVHAAGLRVVYAPGAYVASTDHIGGREFLRWIVRQMVIAKVHDPQLWTKAFAGHVLYCFAQILAAIVAIQGHLVGLGALAAIFILGMVKGANRLQLAKIVLPAYKDWFARHGWVHIWWVPIGTWVWMYSLLVSAFTTTIEWRGYRYELSAAKARRV